MALGPWAPLWAQPTAHTLVLYSYGYGARGVEVFSNGFITASNALGEGVNDTYFEYLDLAHNTDPDYRRRLAESLRDKYRQRNIAAIVTVQQPALDFLLHEGARLAPLAPAITLQAPTPPASELGGRRIVSLLAHFDVAGTLKSAVDLFPGTQRVLFVSGSSKADRVTAAAARQAAQPWDGQLQFEFTTDLTLDAILRRAATLEPHSVIVFTQFNTDSAGYVAPAYEVEAKLIQSANAPVFGLYDFNLRNGGVGGSVISVDRLGMATARMAHDIEAGTFHPVDAITPREVAAEPMYDWARLVRWGGDPAGLPPQATVLNQPPRLWDGYRHMVVGVTAAFALLLLLVIALLLNRRRRQQAEAVLTQERDRSQLYLDTAQSLMVALDTQGHITMINPAACRLLGYAAEDLLGRNWFRTCLPQPEGEVSVHLYFSRLIRDGAELPEFFENEVITRSGKRRLIAWHNAPLRDPDGRIMGTLSAGEDVTNRRAAEQEIHNLAFFDPLTGLPNRRLLLDRLQQSMAASSRSGHYTALLYLDLDNFKDLNDTRSHEVGDQWLVEVAHRLRGCVREGDTVARVGDDEFVVLLEQLGEVSEYAALHSQVTASKIATHVAAPAELGGHPYAGTLSIGVTLFLGQDVSVEDVLKRADLAMYQAKSAGRNTVRFFDPTMQDGINVRTRLANDLRQAIDAHQFVLHYQPQVNNTDHCVGVEALIRWQSPQRGLVQPGEFIGFAEEHGLILPIGTWVLTRACDQLVEWQNDPRTASLTMAVNVSASQFKQADFVEQALAIIQASGAPAQRLKMEITESLLLDDIEIVIDKMERLRRVGVTFSLDDFGTGYSSLAYVKRLPIDQLKIDQSFVRDVLSDHNDAAICRAIIGLGQSLGLTIIAEGVETQRHWDFLRQLGCPQGQGYLFAKPLPQPELLRWLQRTEQPTASV